MFLSRLVPVVVSGLLLSSTAYSAADKLVPFEGTWAGVTTSADLSGFPFVEVVAEGTGNISHLGRSNMISPHVNDAFTGEIYGDQLFTAANGDTLTAWCTGWGYPQADGSVEGLLSCDFTGGTGRFDGVTGSYEFEFLALPRTDGGPGYVTEATFDGWMSHVGHSRR